MQFMLLSSMSKHQNSTGETVSLRIRRLILSCGVSATPSFHSVRSNWFLTSRESFSAGWVASFKLVLRPTNFRVRNPALFPTLRPNRAIPLTFLFHAIP